MEKETNEMIIMKKLMRDNRLKAELRPISHTPPQGWVVL
jgi:hypothetical protein